MTEHNPSYQEESLVASIIISNQTHDRLKIVLRKTSDSDAHVWMTIDLQPGRTESIIVVPPKYGFHISYEDPDNSGREIRSNSIRFSQAKLDIAVRRKPNNEIIVQAIDEDLPDQTIRVENQTDIKVTAHVTQNDKNVVHPALLDPNTIFEVNLGSDVYYASVIAGSCAGHVAFSAGQILTVTDSKQGGYDLTVSEG